MPRTRVKPIKELKRRGREAEEMFALLARPAKAKAKPRPYKSRKTRSK